MTTLAHTIVVAELSINIKINRNDFSKMSVRKTTLMSGKYMSGNKIVRKINVRKMHVRAKYCQENVMPGGCNVRKLYSGI